MERKVEVVNADGVIKARVTQPQGEVTVITETPVTLQQAYQQVAQETEARAQHMTNYQKGLETFDAAISAWKEIIAQLEATQ